MARKRPEDLRSHRWYGVGDRKTFDHRSRTAQMGYDKSDYAGKPVIAIINTWSDINPCHAHFRARAEEVKRGVWQAGGFPVEMPAIDAGRAVPETLDHDVPQLPRDGDRGDCCAPIPPTAACSWAAATRPRRRSSWARCRWVCRRSTCPRGRCCAATGAAQVLGSGSDSRKYWQELRAGTITENDWEEIEEGIARSLGHCMTMGTASTMTSSVEALGLTLPGAASIPAADSHHANMATATGKRAVELVWDDADAVRPAHRRRRFDNAVTCVLAFGGSTNSVIHLIAMARRAGVQLDLETFEAAREDAGDREPAPLRQLSDGGLLLRRRPARPAQATGDRGTAEARRAHGQRRRSARTSRARKSTTTTSSGRSTIRSSPPAASPSCAATSRPTARSSSRPPPRPACTSTRARRSCSRTITTWRRASTTPISTSTRIRSSCCKHAGPIGAPGMPEWGQLPIPKKLLPRACATWCGFRTRG